MAPKKKLDDGKAKYVPGRWFSRDVYQTINNPVYSRNDAAKETGTDTKQVDDSWRGAKEDHDKAGSDPFNKEN